MNHSTITAPLSGPRWLYEDSLSWHAVWLHAYNGTPESISICLNGSEANVAAYTLMRLRDDLYRDYQNGLIEFVKWTEGECRILPLTRHQLEDESSREGGILVRFTPLGGIAWEVQSNTNVDDHLEIEWENRPRQHDPGPETYRLHMTTKTVERLQRHLAEFLCWNPMSAIERCLIETDFPLSLLPPVNLDRKTLLYADWGDRYYELQDNNVSFTPCHDWTPFYWRPPIEMAWKAELLLQDTHVCAAEDDVPQAYRLNGNGDDWPRFAG